METTALPHRHGLGTTLLLLLASLLCVLGLSFLVTSAANAATVSTSTLGVYVGGGDISDFTGFSQWLGATPAYVLDYTDGSSWSTIDDPTWIVGQWAGSGAQPVLSVPMLPPSGATLAQGATGAYDSYFRTLAENLVADGDSNAILRLGWEMNGNWYPWSIQNGNAANYAAYWQQIVTTMRAVSPSFRFDFCPSSGPTTVNGVVLDPENAYPGDAYVNYIGLDQYDESWVSDWQNEANRWQGYLTQAYGLEWQKSFAAAHDKQVSFPEWGLVQGANGGGDSPAFVQDMYNWMASYGSDLAYENYFDVSNSALSDFPNAEALYQELFSSSSSTTTTPPPTSTPPVVTTPITTPPPTSTPPVVTPPVTTTPPPTKTTPPPTSTRSVNRKHKKQPSAEAARTRKASRHAVKHTKRIVKAHRSSTHS